MGATKLSVFIKPKIRKTIGEFMLRTVGGAFLMVFGIPLAIGGLFANKGFLLVLLGVGMVYLGQQWYRGRRVTDAPVGSPAVKRPNVPSGFQTSFWNRNIALDQASGALWVRDTAGAAMVLQPTDIVAWEGTCDSSNHQTLVGPKTARLNSRLMIKTRDLSKPVWTVPFNAHPQRTEGGANANYAELQEWIARLDALYGRAS
jgi:hypothetical protein